MGQTFATQRLVAQSVGVEEQMKAALIESQVIHQDETGMRVGKEGWWVHVCSTKRLTHYGVHRCRGREGLEAIGIAPAFGGTSVHDGLGSYQSYSFTQALCNVHHLRELTFIEEECKQPWARSMKDLLLEMKSEVEQARSAGKSQLDLLVLVRLLRRYDEILAQGTRPICHQNRNRSEARDTSANQASSSKARHAISWIGFPSTSGRCCDSCTTLPCPSIIIRLSAICAW